jgi:large subunit ribosomal protein L32
LKEEVPSVAIVPKRKHSKARRNIRRSNVWKLEAPALSRCSKCGAFKLIHRVCKSCGYYRNREVVKKEA